MDAGCNAAVPPPDDDPAPVQRFVEHYLATRGHLLSTRNARLVTAALSSCPEGVTDWTTLERHVDAALDHARLRSGA